MAYLHDNKVQHHDLKTDNILVFPRAESMASPHDDAQWNAKLSDFGLEAGASGKSLSTMSKAHTTRK
eukprot:5998580-Prymnesium_polylepis.1